MSVLKFIKDQLFDFISLSISAGVFIYGKINDTQIKSPVSSLSILGSTITNKTIALSSIALVIFIILVLIIILRKRKKKWNKMPYKIRKMPNNECYRVTNAITGKVHAYCTSRRNAYAQVRLLMMRERK